LSQTDGARASLGQPCLQKEVQNVDSRGVKKPDAKLQTSAAGMLGENLSNLVSGFRMDFEFDV
jgi:hypothetical protein